MTCDFCNKEIPTMDTLPRVGVDYYTIIVRQIWGGYAFGGANLTLNKTACAECGRSAMRRIKMDRDHIEELERNRIAHREEIDTLEQTIKELWKRIELLEEEVNELESELALSEGREKKEKKT